MPTLLTQGIVHNLKANEVYALPAQEIVYNSEQSIELSNSGEGPWSPASDIGRTYENQIIADGAVAYWRLDEAGNPIKSIIAGVPDGTATGSITPGIAGALSDGNKGVNFNPTGPLDGQVAIPNSSYSTFGTGEFSIECWFKRANIAISADEVPIVLGSIFTASSVAFRVSAANITFIGKDSGNISSTALTPTPPYLDDKWHHMIGVVRRGNPNDTIEIWIDGILKNSSTFPTGRNFTTSSGATIGANLGNNEFQGGVDEVVIYKAALSPAQITNHYAARARTYQEYVIQDGAVAYWRLNESSGTTVKSLVSGVPDGTISGGVTLGINGALSDDDKAMNFNGTNGYISIADVSILDLTTALTIEAWVKITNISGIVTILVKGQFGIAYGYGMIVSNGRLGYRWNNGDFITSTTVLTVGVWKHVTIVADESATPVVKLYVDGIEFPGIVGSGQAPTGDFIIANNHPLEIGHTPGAGGQYFPGDIDEVAIYKMALSPEQIKNHYEARKIISSYSQRVVNDGAVAYWRLNEVSGTVAKSIINGPPDGTIYGAVTLGISGALSDGDKGMSFNPAGETTGLISIASGPWNTFDTGPITVECWMRSQAPITMSSVLFAPVTHLSVTGSVSLALVNTQQLQWRLCDPSGNITNPTIPFGPLMDGKWHHVVGILRRSSPNDIHELWVDGTLAASTTAPSGRSYTLTPPGKIAGHASGAVATLEVDECAVYKVALTPAQIQSHYQSSKLNYSKAIKGGFIRSSADGRFICKS